MKARLIWVLIAAIVIVTMILPTCMPPPSIPQTWAPTEPALTMVSAGSSLSGTETPGPAPGPVGLGRDHDPPAHHAAAAPASTPAVAVAPSTTAGGARRRRPFGPASRPRRARRLRTRSRRRPPPVLRGLPTATCNDLVRRLRPPAGAAADNAVCRREGRRSRRVLGARHRTWSPTTGPLLGLFTSANTPTSTRSTASTSERMTYRASADFFDRQTYPVLHRYFGSELSPGIDGDSTDHHRERHDHGRGRLLRVQRRVPTLGQPVQQRARGRVHQRVGAAARARRRTTRSWRTSSRT